MKRLLNRVSALMLVTACLLSSNRALAQFTPGHFFLDNFEDGDLEDADPVRWARGRWSAQEQTVIDGDLHVIQSRQASLLAPVSAEGQAYLAYDNHSIRTQVRLLNAGAEDTTVGLVARVTSGASAVAGAGINTEGVIDVWHFSNGRVTNKQELQTDLDPTTTDVLLQFDLLDDQISLTAWGEGLLQPPTPQVSITGTHVDPGTFELRVHGRGTPADAVFRWVEVVPIPEPSAYALAAIGLVALGMIRPRGRKAEGVGIERTFARTSGRITSPQAPCIRPWVMIAAILASAPWACAVAQPQRPGDVGNYSVGHLETKPENDPFLRHTLYLWYPVNPQDAVGAQQSHYTVGGGTIPSELALNDVPVSAEGPFPVVIYFHGNGAWGAQQPSLAETLASYGFVVAAMTSNTKSNYMLSILDELSARPEHPLFGSVNTDSAGLVGLSAGAGAALSGDLLDDRVKAVMPIAGSGTSPRSTAHMLVLTGTLDAPKSSRRTFAQRRAGDRYFASIEGAGHVSYADWCNRIEYADEHLGPDSIPGYRAWAPHACTDEHIDNEVAIDLTNFYATAFFGKYLQGDDSYGDLLTVDYARDLALPVEFEAVMADDRPGDANRDGRFDFADLVQVSQSGYYETRDIATWRTGDWTHDARFTSDDLVIAFEEGWYEADLGNAEVVPEPNTSLMFALAVAPVLIRRRCPSWRWLPSEQGQLAARRRFARYRETAANMKRRR